MARGASGSFDFLKMDKASAVAMCTASVLMFGSVGSSEMGFIGKIASVSPQELEEIMPKIQRQAYDNFVSQEMENCKNTIVIKDAQNAAKDVKLYNVSSPNQKGSR